MYKWTHTVVQGSSVRLQFLLASVYSLGRKMWVLLGTFSKHVGILWCIYCKEKYTFACQRLRSSHFMMNFISKKKALWRYYISLYCMAGWLGPSPQMNFRSQRLNPLLYQYSCVFPQP